MVFEYELDLGKGLMSSLIHEPNNDLWNYRINDSRLDTQVATPPKGVYTNLSFENKPTMVTVKQINDFKAKHLPGFGAYGFFTLKYRDVSYVLCPIHFEEEVGEVPEVTISDLGNNQHHFIISSSEFYNAYRIEMILENRTEEKIVYALDGTAEVTLQPELAGELLVYVTGYKDEISISSEPWQGYLISTGTPPYIPSSAAEGIIITLLAEEWEDEIQTLTAYGVTSSNIVIVSPIPSYQVMYTSYEILCIEQGTNQLTFKCNGEPLVDIDVQVVIL